MNDEAIMSEGRTVVAVEIPKRDGLLLWDETSQEHIHRIYHQFINHLQKSK